MVEEGIGCAPDGAPRSKVDVTRDYEEVYESSLHDLQASNILWGKDQELSQEFWGQQTNWA